jgi:hypothetical protein
MKTNLNLVYALMILAGFSNGCGSKNSDRQAPPETFSSVTIEGAQTATVADPKVNILFVVDNSGSMKNYQAKLATNIRLFAETFFNNTRIDYRIGVVPVYDSKYLNDTTVYNSGVRKMNALGELVPLKGLSSEDKGSSLYITRNTIDPEEVLRQTVLIGTQWGPEAEESFSPVLAITNPEINSNKNEGFYQADAHLAVIFLTDADDVTPSLSGEDFYQRLLALKGGDRSKVLIAAALPSLSNNSSDCSKDGKGPLQSFPALLAASGAILADLCSNNFGAKLADFGQYLTQQVASQKIALKFTPDINSLVVTYGPKDSAESDRAVLPRGADGYFFNTETNEIILSSTMKVPRRENSVIFVRATPASLGNYKNGRLKQI